MKLDSSKAWQDGAAMVTANKEVLIVLAGVFFLLPGLAFSLFVPQPQPPAEAGPEALQALLLEYYVKAAPWFVVIALIQALGQLATMVLLSRAGRSTVGEAIREAFGAMPSFIGVQLLTALAGGIAAAVLMAIGKLSGSVALAVVLALVLLGVAIWVAARLMMTLPVIGIERQRNPVAAIRRSWQLTQDNAGRILLFFFLIVLVAVIAGMVAGAVVGIVLNLIAGQEAATIGGAVIGGLVSAVLSLYLTACLAAMHRQLAGAWEAEIGETFA